jgi:hypothetical protein
VESSPGDEIPVPVGDATQRADWRGYSSLLLAAGPLFSCGLFTAGLVFGNPLFAIVVFYLGILSCVAGGALGLADQSRKGGGSTVGAVGCVSNLIWVILYIAVYVLTKR